MNNWIVVQTDQNMEIFLFLISYGFNNNGEVVQSSQIMNTNIFVYLVINVSLCWELFGFRLNLAKLGKQQLFVKLQLI